MSLPPVEIPLGAMRFNSDSQKLEYFNGDIWLQIRTFNHDLNGGCRGLIMAGQYSSPGPGTHDQVRYITISTAGDTTDFGDTTTPTRDGSSCASNTRGLYRYGTAPGADINDHVDYWTFSSTGNATDFGDMTYNARGTEGLSNQTRGIFAGGNNDSGTHYNNIDYITIASTGNGADFGDLTTTVTRAGGGSSPTRGIFWGSWPGSNPVGNTISFVTIATLGNAIEFGEAGNVTTSSGAACSSTRMVCGGTKDSVGWMDSINMASGGRAIKFGNMQVARSSFASMSDCVRGVWAGGDGSPTQFNEIGYITIATQGDEVDFGDLPYKNQQTTGASNGHGGLG